MDNLENELKGTADTAEAEDNGKKAATDLGKFKDVKALLEAYAGLEAEFTRRSQRLAELERRNKAERLPDADGAAPSPERTSGEELYKLAKADEKVRGRIIAEYLGEVASGKGVPIIAGGISVPSPAGKPATIKEAGRLAKEFLKNN